ncbi:MAG: L,D-transpeptidase family protein [Verrucomicrobiota bacterium]
MTRCNSRGGLLGNSVRWALLVLFLFAFTPEIDAGLFEKLRAKRQARLAEQAKANQKPRPRPVYRSHYRDAHGDAYINHALLEIEKDCERKVIVDIGRQRMFLIVNDLIAIDSAISSARRGKYTPRGTFEITERVKSGKVSTIYHVYMPNWMRLGHSTVGMHTGDLPGYPASAGCIRLPQSVAPILFENTSRGVTVEVVDFWDESGLAIPYSRPQRDLFVAL